MEFDKYLDEIQKELESVNCNHEEVEETQMMPCDYSGICGGMSCSNYWNCQV